MGVLAVKKEEVIRVVSETAEGDFEVGFWTSNGVFLVSFVVCGESYWESKPHILEVIAPGYNSGEGTVTALEGTLKDAIHAYWNREEAEDE